MFLYPVYVKTITVLIFFFVFGQCIPCLSPPTLKSYRELIKALSKNLGMHIGGVGKAFLFLSHNLSEILTLTLSFLKRFHCHTKEQV